MLKVEAVESYRITARPPESVPPICPGCGVVGPKLYRFGTLHPEFADVPHHGKPTVLIVERQRWQCRECGKTFLHPIEEIDESRMATKRLIEYVQKRSSEDTFSRIARDTGMHEKTVRNIVREFHVEEEEKRRFLPPRVLGLDEVYLLHRPRAVITNLDENTMIDLLPNRYRQTVERRLFEITPPGSVEVAAIDMWKDYRQAVHNVHPDAIVVVDKFHIQRYANVAVEAVRRGLRADLTKGQRVLLKRERGVLLKRRHALQDRDRLRLEGWTGSFLWLSRAYDLKEDFFGIWDETDRAAAWDRYVDWASRIPDELVPAFKPLTTAVKNWDREIFNYWEHPVTNAATEALNGITKMVNRMGRGYSFDVLRSKILDRRQSTKRKRVRDVEPSRLVYVHRGPTRGVVYGTATFGKATLTKSILETARFLDVGIDVSTLPVMTEAQAREWLSTPESE